MNKAERTRNLILKPPGNLKPEEWDTIGKEFEGHVFAEVMAKVRAGENRPQRSRVLFEGFDASVENQAGVDTINNLFRSRKLPYRLTRIGTWAHEGDRGNRKLAIVPWPTSRGEQAPSEPSAQGDLFE